MKKLLILLLFAGIALSQNASDLQNNRTITIYKDGFATLKEPITWNLKSGRNVVGFTNLSPNIVFDSPNLDLEGVQILSQTMNRNFNSSDVYLKNNIGSQVELKPTGTSAIQGTLLDVNGSSVSINTNKGLMVFQRSSIEYLNLKLNNVSNKFTPEIFWEIFSNEEKSINAELTYLSSGFSWKPIYKLELNKDNTSAILSVDAEVVNHSNVNLLGLNINVVEGVLNQVGVKRDFVSSRAVSAPMIQNGTKLGDFYIFNLGRLISRFLLITLKKTI